MELTATGDMKIVTAKESKITSVDFDNLSFGNIFTDHMLVCDYDNGVWVRGETTVFDPKKLPATINDAISKQYAGYIIKDVDREESKSQVLYEVELVKGNEKCKIHYTADGSIAKKKCRTS